MKRHVSFSNEVKEKTSLNFFELRQKGLQYLQQLSGTTWTDFNSHDPGVTILEQLCYGLTDVALRSSYNLNDLLTKKNKEGNHSINYTKNGFFSAPDIFSSHPFTEIDVKKAVLDEFPEIQNLWIQYTDNSGLEEKMVIIKKIELLPKTFFFNTVNLENLEKRVTVFLSKIRNLGEDVEKICLLSPRYVNIEIEIEINENQEVEESIANLLLDLFEYIYVPIHRYTLEEMLADKMSTEDIFSGPKMKFGFIKENEFKDRIKELKKERLERILTKRKSINRCKIKNINFHKTSEYNYDSLKINENENPKENNKFKDDSLKINDNLYFELLFSKGTKDENNLKSDDEKVINTVLSNIQINNKKIVGNQKQKISHLFYKLWTKKYRPYRLNNTKDLNFNKPVQGTFYDIENYHSIQNQFPSIYGVGTDGLPKSASNERKAKAKQLKAYLLLFEQHLANEFSQISHIDDFFDITYKDNSTNKRTYYSQNLSNSNVPNIEEIFPKSSLKEKKEIEQKNPKEKDSEEKGFFDRKNRIYDHLLARFGENFESTFFQINKEDESFNKTLLHKKSEYLKKIDRLSSNSPKGECFYFNVSEKCNDESKNEREQTKPSGLENIILAKTNLKKNREGNATINQENGFFIVDHIMLRDFLNQEVEYGFKFIDALGKVLCSTKKDVDSSWCKTEEQREKRIENLFEKFKNDKNLFDYTNESPNKKGKILKLNDIQGKDGNCILATFANEYNEKNEVLSLMQLFDKKSTRNSKMRFSELEEIRHKGIHIYGRGQYGQRRLIYQRRLKNPVGMGKVIIDEDFFNLSISVVLPSSIETKNNPQYHSYLKSFITERVPSHIKLNIYMLDDKPMNIFKEKYNAWEQKKTEYEKRNNESNTNLEAELKKISFRVYDFLQGIQQEQKENHEQKAKFNELWSIVKNSKKDDTKSLDAINELNQIVPQYRNQLSPNNIDTEEITEQTNKYLEDLLKIKTSKRQV
tara:strand:+ start:2290 stop:5232 length:2943 start_codon:yes stop_codon:yes gene_type:complete